ncbi:MAG TPA: cytochrome b N-terminal domain-containing protein [Acidimicrobiales bacterium]|nr:cytochrome b N-terminal domain-containing protein [Acidimicrobiales bacterium]
MATTVDHEPPEHRSRARRALDVVDDRLGIKALEYPVPEHANGLGWSLGGLTAATLVVLIATGIFLAQWYNPVPEEANASVRYLVTHVWAGEFLRSVHFWAAQAMYVLAVLHLLRVFVTGSYKAPREANWLVGVAMFALVLGAIFTGTVMKWDQEGFEALGHNLEIGRLVGGLGFWFSPRLARDVSILTRLYVAHIAIIPGLLLGLFALHGMLLKRHGISPDPVLGAVASEPTEPFTHHLRRIAAFALVVAAALGALALLWPRGVGPTPVEGIEVTKPPWMFWWLFTLENWVGLKGILWGTGVLFAVLVAVPFVDRSPDRWWRRRPVAMVLGALVLVLLVALTVLMAVTTPAQHLG